MTELVSICIPTYNGEEYLHECLDSAVAQDYPETEIIIVDDRSTDNTVSIAKEYSARFKKISVYENDRNLGLVGNWNRCMELAKGEWIKFLFQDDFIEKNCLSRLLQFSENEQFIVSNRDFIFDDDVPTDVRNTYQNNLHTLDKILRVKEPGNISAEQISRIVARLVNTNFIGEPTVVMFRRNLLDRIGVFSSDLVQICDLEYWLRIALNYGLYYVPENLAHFRVHNKSMSSQNRISGRYYVDKIVLTNALLTSKYYSAFRKRLSGAELRKIRLMFRLRIHEVMRLINEDPSNEKLISHYRSISSKNHLIAANEKASLFTKLIFYLVRQRRKLN
jgi:glycosyltransferase involved in cell wall biosynthesis